MQSATFQLGGDYVVFFLMYGQLGLADRLTENFIFQFGYGGVRVS